MHTMYSEMGAHDVIVQLFTKLCCAHAQCGRQLIHERTNKRKNICECERILFSSFSLPPHCMTEMTKNNNSWPHFGLMLYVLNFHIHHKLDLSRLKFKSRMNMINDLFN